MRQYALSGPNPTDESASAMAAMPASDVAFATPKRIAVLETTTSFAEMPAMRAVEICQKPKPIGAKKGTQARPITRRETLPHVLGIALRAEGQKQPQDDRCHEDDRTRTLYVVEHLLLHVDSDRARGRNLVFRQLDQKPCRLPSLALLQHMHDPYRNKRHEQADHVQRIMRLPSRSPGRRSPRTECIWQARRTGHERGHEHGLAPVARILQRARGHDGRNRAPEPEHERQECAARKAEVCP